MAETYPSVTSLVDDASVAYTRRFGRAPSHVVYAPGRVNLIGEHTDYNDGFVLPMALPLVTVVVGGVSVAGQCHVITTSSEADQPHDVTFPVPTPDAPLIPSPPVWSNYVKGVVANYKGSVSGFDAAVSSSVPLGSGLSSSAALEVAFYTFLEAMNKQPAASLEEKAKQCQLAEHLFAGVPCGIMDQLISVKASPDHALLIDCRSLKTEQVALEDPAVSVLIINSHVRHQLSGSEYPDRRAACHQAAAALHVPSLRDATLHALQERVNDLTDEQFRRARHVISEIERTQRAAAALKDADYISFGKLMLESHKSLRDDFEVSCVECDQLVDLCSSVDGVFGSRMTGAGFGGCTVTLLRSDAVEPCIKHVKSNYRGKASIYICRPSGGAAIYSA